MWRAWVVIVCGACTFRGPGAAPTDADSNAVDAPADGPPDAFFDGIDFLPVSEERFSELDWTVAVTTVIDTSSLVITPTPPEGVMLELGVQDNGQPVAILRAKNFKINAGVVVRAIGDRPLAILAGHDATIEGTLDVGAHGDTRGPGGSPGAMGMGAGGISIHDNGTGSTYDDSGAGGGSYGTAGARGGKAGPFLGGAPGATYSINGLLGGSGGGAAGVCLNPPGAGGGALLLYGDNKINVKGAITAGGGGGAGGLAAGCATGAGAGAGGGSGGLIWLQTPNIDGDGILAANGGGGGGASYVGVANGGPGTDGFPSATLAATGGTKANSNEASAGGAGAVQGTDAAPIVDLAAGNGGGGGGGLGRIVYHAPDLAMVKSSPTAVTP